ncbi:MAG: bifunctional serine/threonine-protein kinase/formylglycine-generating enzyme family protein [Acidobacteriota bacterium]|nr:bifunctional serine/threonine-protein kinase/formylglycine-generating enzyme family protein [Acidobacteriota bacterium]
MKNRYRILRKLAQGGMGVVYEAEDIHLGNARVAVKEAFFDDTRPDLREQFEREAATLARLRHPALPHIKDHFREGGRQFLVMDFIAGDDLGKLLVQHLRKYGEPFDWQIVLDWAACLLDVLAYIHSQKPPVIHRDIKPDNLKLTPQGELFLIDFGLAKETITPSHVRGIVGGYTLDYASPEQLKETGTDRRSDLFSLGATLYHLLTGKLPDNAQVRDEIVNRHRMPDPLRQAHEVYPPIPPPLAEVLARAMALNPRQRYQTAQEMRKALQQAKQYIREEATQWQQQEQERWPTKVTRKRREKIEVRLSGVREERQPQVTAAHDQSRPGRIKREANNFPARKSDLKRRESAFEGEGEWFMLSRRWRFQLLIVGAVLIAAMGVGLIMWIFNSPSEPPPQIETVYVPSGSFFIGSADSEPGHSDDEKPQLHVEVRGFYLGKYEITQAQWTSVMGNNPSNNKGDHLPVENISLDDSLKFCRKLSWRSGKTYRLPTEDEWEYACRAGATGAYAGDLKSMAWYSNNSSNETHPVGQKQPNIWKLHDMHGNVREWCNNRYGNYSDVLGEIKGSILPSVSAPTEYVNRGGSYSSGAVACRSADRHRDERNYRSAELGFRIVKEE